MGKMQDILSLSIEELREEILKLGEKPFRAVQIYEWLHKKLVTDYGEMTNLPKTLRETLSEKFPLEPLVPVKTLISQVDGTRKYLFGLSDGNVIESVWMQYHHGDTVCISSQVGCRMGCRFCASGIGGLVRNLTAGEMLSQVYSIQKDTGERVSHVVVMGTGEPFDNYDALVRFLKMISDENGLNISQRDLTVSTCGIVPGIRRFADEGMAVTLALSLHAPDDEKRREIMPVARRYPLAEVLEACRYYQEKTGRRVTFEYSLIKDVNDSPKEAGKLAALLRGLHGHVNLIPVNPVRERSFRRSEREAVDAFRRVLEDKGITVTVRREMGSDIDASCGQLRRSFMESRSTVEKE